MPELSTFEAASCPTGRRRVLVVEDEGALRELLSEVLEDDGFEPVCVQNDKTAYEALRRGGGDFACVIVDVNLGKGTTGYDVARFARKVARGVPVIYVSGQTSEASYRANGVPGSLLLPKPFTPTELMTRLRVLVGLGEG